MNDFDQVLMNIKSYGGSMTSLLIQSTTISVKLLVFLYRMARKQLVSYKFGTDYMNFLEKTGGKFTVYNIPLSEKHAMLFQEKLELIYELEDELVATKNPIKKSSLQKRIDGLRQEMPEIEQLKKLNIDLCVLPKINSHNNMMQVAIANKDGEIFKNWYVNHISENMGGGPKSMKELEAMTESNYTIQNLAIEGDILQEAFEDFKTLHINYSVLPDLNVGDNYTQIAVANADINKLVAWYKMYQNKLKTEGVSVPDMKEINTESYIKTGTVDIDTDYIQKSDSVYREADMEYANQSQDIVLGTSVKNDTAEEYFALSNDIRYEKVTINKETLVDGISQDIFGPMSEKGYFISRIPGTFGDGEMNMILPNDKVFLADNKQTYIGFLSKKDAVRVYNVKEKKIEHWSYDEVKKNYDFVERGFKKVEQIIKREKHPDIDPTVGVQPIMKDGVKKVTSQLKIKR